MPTHGFGKWLCAQICKGNNLCCVCCKQALAADDTAFAAWQKRHKGQLRGSSRVLAALQHSYPDALMPLLTVPAKRAAFVALMPALRQRHQYVLRTGKGWQVWTQIVIEYLPSQTAIDA